MPAKKTPGQQQPSHETVLSLKYIPRPAPSSSARPNLGEGRRNEQETPEHHQPPRNYSYPRTAPKPVVDKRAAANLLQSKVGAHARNEMNSRSAGRAAPPYPGPRSDRVPPGYPQGGCYKGNDAGKKPSGLELFHPQLEIIHSRSKSEPWDPVHPQDGFRRTYKETTLGPHITTVETFRENYDNAMSDTVDQIERAFGGSPVPPDKSPSLQRSRKDRRAPPNNRLQDSESYLSSTSNESLPTSETFSDSDREKGSNTRNKPFSSRRLVSKKIGVRAEITSTTAKSTGPNDTQSRDVSAPSIQSSTTVFVRSKSNDTHSEGTSSLKRSPRNHNNPAPRTVNREEVVLSRENSAVLTPRKRPGIIRQLSQGDPAYVYSPRPFHMSNVSQKGAHEQEAFQFPDTDTRVIRDERPKIVSQTKISLMSPPGNSPTQSKAPESFTTGASRSPPSAAQEKGNRANRVPYFVKNKREHGGITPELVDERISKIQKQRSKSSPDGGRRATVTREIERESSSFPRRSGGQGSQLKQSQSQSSLVKEGPGESVLNEATTLLSDTAAISRNASTTVAETEEILANLEKVLSDKNEKRKEGQKSSTASLDDPPAVRARLPSGE